MNKRLALGVSGLAVLALAATGCAGGSTSSESSAAASEAAPAASEAAPAASEAAAAVQCTGNIAVMAPLTGGAASIGQEQLNFAKLAVEDHNAATGATYAIVESDTQLDAGQASTQATSIASDTGIIGVVGPAGSQEVNAIGPTF